MDKVVTDSSGKGEVELFKTDSACSSEIHVTSLVELCCKGGRACFFSGRGFLFADESSEFGRVGFGNEF